MNKRIVFLCMAICLIFSSVSQAEINKSNDALQSTQNELAAITDKLQLEYERSEELADEIDNLIKELEESNEIISDLKDTEYELVYMGEFKLTHYCCEARKHICGTGDGITATGTRVTAGRTIAVDPKVIPYGTHVYIEGYGWRIAEDCGGAIKKNHIDIAVETHSEALAMGVKSGDVWILVEKSS